MKKYTVMNNIGFMQGRLVDKVKNNIQFFPDKSWIQELHIAEKENFKLMEWTINYENIKKNPFFTGNKKLLKKILDFKRIKIKTVTCDFFMQRPFFKKKYSKKKNSYINDLLKIIKNSNTMNIKYLILPLVDNSSINSLKEEKELIQVLKKKIFPKLHKLKILFETDYKPTDVLTFIRKFKSNKVGINYDTGNSASLNYKIDDEKKYFHHVKNIHIKDRLKYGKTIRLGKGNWDYISFFKLIKKLNYKGFLILQTARAKKKQHVTELNINRKFLLRYL